VYGHLAFTGEKEKKFVYRERGGGRKKKKKKSKEK
jgi:hypothetical protein